MTTIENADLSLLTPGRWLDADVRDAVADGVVAALDAAAPRATTRRLGASTVDAALRAHAEAVASLVRDGRAGEVSTNAHGGAVPNSYGYGAEADWMRLASTVNEAGDVARHELTWSRGHARTQAGGGGASHATHVTHHGPVAERGFKTRAAAERVAAARLAEEMATAARLAGMPGYEKHGPAAVAVVPAGARWLVQVDHHRGARAVTWLGVGGREAGFSPRA